MVFKDIEIVESWGSYVDCMLDVVLVMFVVDDVEGFYLVVGCLGYGFGLGLGLVKVVVDLVVNNILFIDVMLFNLLCLNDGLKIEVGVI